MKGESKVLDITLVSWIVEIAVTTPGETGGDRLSMSLNLGYLIGSATFALLFRRP